MPAGNGEIRTQVSSGLRQTQSDHSKRARRSPEQQTVKAPVPGCCGGRLQLPSQRWAGSSQVFEGDLLLTNLSRHVGV